MATRTVGEVVKSRPVYVVQESDSVLDAARYMTEYGVEAVPVLDDGRLVGMFAGRDLVARVVALGLDPATTRVGQVMTDKVVVVEADSSYRDAVMLMDRLEVRHLPVLTGRRLVGCVSLRDLQSAGTEGAQTEAKSVEKTDSTRERHVVLLQATDMFEMAMQVEKSGEAFYRAAADKVDSHGVKDLFEDLALQEVRHYEFFRSLFQSIRGQPLLTAEQWHEYQGYLGATVQSAFFEGPDKALALAETVKDHHEAVRMAMEFEKETLLFFYDLRDIVPASGRKAVHEIVEEEKSHIRRLAGMLQDNG